MFDLLNDDWKTLLESELQQEYLRDLETFVAAERAAQHVFPPANETFAALEATPPDRVRVVLLGQDPYHGEGQAHGYCFSVRRGVKPPPSLVNVFKELHADLGIVPPPHGDLRAWARQGVLLLNAVLTVRAHEAGSHRKRGWERFTDAVLRRVAAADTHRVFVLWGNYAREKATLLDRARHTILESAHPSPLSARQGFFGSQPFSKINQALVAAGGPPIDWRLD